MLEQEHGRELVYKTLRGLLERQLMTTFRGRYVGLQRAREDTTRSWHVDYEDDWWDVAPAGRAVVDQTER